MFSYGECNGAFLQVDALRWGSQALGGLQAKAALLFEGNFSNTTLIKVKL